jgi:hypothetical protein
MFKCKEKGRIKYPEAEEKGTSSFFVFILFKANEAGCQYGEFFFQFFRCLFGLTVF